MLPTTETEFVVRDVPVFLCYLKDQATGEFNLVVHQGNQKYIARKMKWGGGINQMLKGSPR